MSLNPTIDLSDHEVEMAGPLLGPDRDTRLVGTLNANSNSDAGKFSKYQQNQQEDHDGTGCVTGIKIICVALITFLGIRALSEADGAVRSNRCDANSYTGDAGASSFIGISKGFLSFSSTSNARPREREVVRAVSVDAHSQVGGTCTFASFTSLMMSYTVIARAYGEVEGEEGSAARAWENLYQDIYKVYVNSTPNVYSKPMEQFTIGACWKDVYDKCRNTDNHHDRTPYSRQRLATVFCEIIQKSSPATLDLGKLLKLKYEKLSEDQVGGIRLESTNKNRYRFIKDGEQPTRSATTTVWYLRNKEWTEVRDETRKLKALDGSESYGKADVKKALTLAREDNELQGRDGHVMVVKGWFWFKNVKYLLIKNSWGNTWAGVTENNNSFERTWSSNGHLCVPVKLIPTFGPAIDRSAFTFLDCKPVVQDRYQRIHSRFLASLSLESEDQPLNLISKAKELPGGLESRGANSMTLLMLAAQAGNPVAVKTLLEERANFNAINDEGKTAFMIAVEAGHNEVVKTFLNAIVGLPLEDVDKRIAEHEKKIAHNQKLIAEGRLHHYGVTKEKLEEEIKEAKEGIWRINWSLRPTINVGVGRDDNESNKKFGVRRFGVLEFRDEKGMTPLMLAAQAGNSDTVRVLLENGAKVEEALVPGNWLDGEDLKTKAEELVDVLKEQQLREQEEQQLQLDSLLGNRPTSRR